MNAKHYVSLEAAKKLKEKKYESNSGFFFHAVERNYKLVYGNPLKPDELIKELYYAPTLLEAMDWLEERGVRVVIRHRTQSYDRKIVNYWYYEIVNREYRTTLEYDVDGIAVMHTDRNECMQKAIEKALELL